MKNIFRYLKTNIFYYNCINYFDMMYFKMWIQTFQCHAMCCHAIICLEVLSSAEQCFCVFLQLPNYDFSRIL